MYCNTLQRIMAFGVNAMIAILKHNGCPIIQDTLCYFILIHESVCITNSEPFRDDNMYVVGCQIDLHISSLFLPSLGK